MQENNYLIHFGNKNSGRYRRGSGERPNQHEGLKLGAKVGAVNGALVGAVWGGVKAKQAIARHNGLVNKGQYYAVGILGGAAMESLKGAAYGAVIGAGADKINRMLGR